MSDAFRTSMDEITLTSAQNGERVPVAAVLKAMMALHESLNARFDELSKATQENMRRHCEENLHMTPRQFDDFIAGRDKMLALSVAQTDDVPKRRENDSRSEDHIAQREHSELENRTFFMWTIGAKATYIAIALAIAFVTMFGAEMLAWALGMK